VALGVDHTLGDHSGGAAWVLRLATIIYLAGLALGVRLSDSVDEGDEGAPAAAGNGSPQAGSNGSSSDAMGIAPSLALLAALYVRIADCVNMRREMDEPRRCPDCTPDQVCRVHDVLYWEALKQKEGLR